MTKRVFLVVIDSVGIGAAPDAARFDSHNSNTLFNTASGVAGVELPNMERLGLGQIYPLLGVEPHPQPLGNYGSMVELSGATDTTVGHWELMGVSVADPFPTYPDGFPGEVIEPFERAIGRPVIGNKAASGTKIIEDLGEEHIHTGSPIVYTSGDSVFQVAAHEEVIPVVELYRMCNLAREILTGDHAVGRVIARPFVGKPGNFERTHRRKDFSLDPIKPTVMDDLCKVGYTVVAVGKISDIFNGRGVSRSVKTTDNANGIEKTIDLAKNFNEDGLVFVNLVDFDMKFGHRNDPLGYARSLEEWDAGLAELLDCLGQGDILIITADHGNDPTTEGTDHSREMVPLLVYGPGLDSGVDLGVRLGFYDVGQTILDYFDLNPRLEGTSFLPEVTV